MYMGMDFPENAISNVHKIDGIHSIGWALYEPLEDIQAKNRNISPRNRLDSDQVMQLRSLEYELRSNYHHVLYDVDRASIWVFDLHCPGSVAGQRAVPSEEILQASNRFGMKRTNFNSLKSSDLHLDSGVDAPATRVAKAVGSTQAGLIDTQRLNTQLLGSNSAAGTASDMSPLDSPLGSFSVPTIISNMGEAVSASIIFSLAKIRSLAPINGRSCIESLLLRDSQLAKNEAWLDCRRLRTSLNLIRVQWSPFGTLTISISQKLMPGLQRVSEILGDDLERARLRPNSKILVSPSGRVFQYFRELAMSTHPPSSAPQPSSYHLFKAKESIASHLALQGIHITPEERWLLLEDVVRPSFPDNIEYFSKGSVCPIHFLWPARLCFCKLEDNCDVQVWSQTHMNLNIDKDPLICAQSWLEGRAGREEAIEAKRRDDELNARRQKEAQETDLEENLFDFSTQDLSEQDAGGLFAAASDGSRPQNEGSAVNTEKKMPGFEYVDRETTDSAKHEAIPLGSPFDVAPGPNPTSTRYEEPNDTDLFEEMDSGLFAANGLTEADFSFFDEPSIDVEPSLQDGLESGSAQIENRDITDLTLVDGSVLDKSALREISSISVVGENLINKGAKARQGDKQQVADNPEDLLYSRPANSPLDAPCTPIIDFIESSSSYASHPEGDVKSSFDAVLFRDQFQEFDGKYVIRGRFGYEHDPAPAGAMFREHFKTNQRIIPRIGLALDEDTESQATKTSSDQELDDMDDDADTDVSSPLQDEGIYVPAEDEGMPELRKRKRDQEEPITQNSPSSDEQIEESVYYPAAHVFAAGPITRLDISPEDWFQILGSNVPNYCGSDRTFMQVAQILVDQLILQTELSSENAQFSEVFNYQSSGEAQTQDPHAFRDIIGRIFPLSEHCNLGQYANIEREIYEAQNFGTQLPQKGKALSSKPKSLGITRNSLLKVQTPYACVRRNQTSIDLLASALHFWEELGLEPAHESKNISAIYIFPAGDNTQHGVGMFSRMIGNTYQSCKLGIHADISDLSSYPKGLVPVSMHNESATGVILQLTTSCEKLGKDMAQLKAQGGNTVIYMVNPFKNPHTLAHLCAAFLKLFESYLSDLKALHVDKPNDIILQIIPRDFIASASTIALPSPADYKRLAFEIYDRCGPSESGQLGHSGYFCAPSIRLARIMPKRIDLKLSREPSAGLLSSDMCFHMAYSWDPTQYWLTASWTDNQGDLQWNAPYCLGYAVEDDDPWPVLSAILKEIWDTTLEILSPQNSPWRIFIVKDRPLLKRELEIWLSICTQPSNPSTTVTFLTIDSTPPLQFYPPPPSISPLPGTTSTAQTIDTPTTPIADPSQQLPTDPSAKLIDITDSTWSLVLPNFLTDLLLPRHIVRPLMSGYIFKRGGVRDESGLIPAQVHLVHVPPTAQKASDYEPLLQEVLGMYAALGTLARLRRIVDPVRSVMPWHVAAARKANTGVNAMMRWKRE